MTDVRRFWDWFRKAESKRDIFQDPEFSTQLEEHLARINPALSWEIGPGTQENLQLAISPSLRRELVEIASVVVQAAPVIAGWEMHVGRQPKEWNPVLMFRSADGRERTVNATDWTFVLLRYPDGVKELVVYVPSRGLSDDERQSVVPLVLEGFLGELATIEVLDDLSIETQVEEKLKHQVRPIHELPNILGAARPPSKASE